MKKHLLILASLVFGIGQLFAETDPVTFSFAKLKDALGSTNGSANPQISIPYTWKEAPYHVTATIDKKIESAQNPMTVSATQTFTNYTLTVTVAGAGKLKTITFNAPTGKTNLNASTGTYDNGTWTSEGNTTTVTFTPTGNFRLTSFTVDYTPDESYTPEEPDNSPIIPVTTESIDTYEGNDPYVLDLSDGKVYVLNNLGEYERYGVYVKTNTLTIAQPTGNKKIDYIATDADHNAYINTEYIHTANTRIVAEVEITAENGDWNAIFGSRKGGGGGATNALAYFWRAGGSNKGMYKRNLNEIFGRDQATANDAPLNTPITIDADGTTVTLSKDGEIFSTITTNDGCSEGINPLFIFDLSTNDGSADNSRSKMKLYGFKIYENGELVRDYQPIVTPEGVGGLEDETGNGKTLFAAEGSFALSPDAGSAGVSVYEGKIVYNTTDGNVYKYNGSGWVNLGKRTLTPIADENYKNLNNWVTNEGHMGIFRGKWQETSNGYKVDPYEGEGGHEPLMIKVPLEVEADYNFSFTSSWGAYNSWHGVEMHAFVCNFWDLGTTESGLGITGSVLATQAFPFAGGTNVPFSLDFTADRAEQTLLLQFGDVDDGKKGFWFEFNNLLVQKYDYPEAYRVANPYGALLDALINEVEAATLNTTEPILAELATALEAAKAATELSGVELEEIYAQKAALEALQAAYNKAKAIDTKDLVATIALAKAEGINTADAEEFLATGTDNGVKDNLLRILRSKRKLNAAQQFKVDADKVQGSEPAEGEYYLLNVGTGLFLNTTADWGTHISIDNPGMLITLVQDGTGSDELPAFRISGNGWSGLNWQEEYWDKNGEHKSAFRPVDGKENVYYWNVFDNFEWHFVYDVTDNECDGGTQYWNALQKRQKAPADYAEDLNTQWKLVTKAQLTAALSDATNSEPVDATFLINNPNFIKNGGQNVRRGWEGVGGVMSADRDPWYVIEYYMCDVNLKQTIEGLPAGKYQVSVHGFYRDGGSDYEAEKVGKGEELVDNAFLVAYTDEANKVSTALPHPTDEAGKLPGIGDFRNGVEGAFANWPWQANEFFQTGLYKATTSVIEVGQDGKLTIGVESTFNGVEGSWVVVDNFRLTYLGATAAETVTIGEALYATYVAPVDVDFTGTEVSAFAAQAMDGYVHLEPVTTVPAGTAVVVKADAAGTYNVNTTTGASLGATKNELIAATADVTADGTQYILAKQDNEVGFAQATTGTIAAGKGYLQFTTAVKAFYPFAGNDATGISGIEAINGDAPIYNVAGQRLGKMQKGINIVGGKKVLK